MKTINVIPYHVDLENNDSGFVLAFFGNTPGGGKVKVVIRFQFWWLSYLANELWAAIKWRKKTIESAEKSLTEGATP